MTIPTPQVFPPGVSGTPKLCPDWRQRLSALRRWQRSLYEPTYELCRLGLALAPDPGSSISVKANAQGGINLDSVPLEGTHLEGARDTGGVTWLGCLRA